MQDILERLRQEDERREAFVSIIIGFLVLLVTILALT
jgi:hypothetical protein